MANLKDLKANAKNPRRIRDKKLADLKRSLEKFGDLSGFVYNVRSKQLVSGHQRQKALESGTIKIEVRHEKPTKACTVAEGYVLINGERFKYREVDADGRWETEALLAANKHGGEWDADLLRMNLADMPDLDLELTGFDLGELSGMGISMKPLAPIVPAHEDTAWDDHATDSSYESSEGNWEQSGDNQDEDAAYVRENPGPDSSIEGEKIDTINRTQAFEQVQENTVAAGRNGQIIIIISCPSEEVKQKLRDELRAQIEAAGAKFF